MKVNREFTQDFVQDAKIMFSNINKYGEENDKRTLKRQAIQNIVYGQLLSLSLQLENEEENEEILDAIEDVIEMYESSGDRDVLFNYLYEKNIDMWTREYNFIIDKIEDTLVISIYDEDILIDSKFGEIVDNEAYLVIDGRQEEESREKLENIEELANRLNINLDALVNTLADLNTK